MELQWLGQNDRVRVKNSNENKWRNEQGSQRERVESTVCPLCRVWKEFCVTVAGQQLTCQASHAHCPLPACPLFSLSVSLKTRERKRESGGARQIDTKKRDWAVRTCQTGKDKAWRRLTDELFSPTHDPGNRTKQIRTVLKSNNKQRTPFKSLFRL